MRVMPVKSTSCETVYSVPPEAVSVLLRVGSPALRNSLAAALSASPLVQRVCIVNDNDQCLAIQSTNDGVITICCFEHFQRTAWQPNSVLVVGETNAEALHAFSARAAGFIHYPVSLDKLNACLARRLREIHKSQQRRIYERVCRDLSLQSGISRAALMARLNRINKRFGGNGKLALRSACEWLYLDQKDVRWIDAAGDYLVVHCYDDNHVVRCTLCDMQRKLGPQFIRISRSTIVNCDAIQRAEKPAQRVVYLILQDGVRLKVSRRYLMDPKQLDRWL